MRLFLVLCLASYSLCEQNYTIQDIEEVFRPIPVDAPAVELQPPPLGGAQYDTNLTEDDFLDDYNTSVAEYDRFDWILTKRIAVLSNENFLISPLGLKLALAILVEASTGATHAEISNVLGLDVDNEIVRKKFSQIIHSLQTKSSEYILELGSKIFVGLSVHPPQQFAAIADNFYKTQITSLDFSQPVAAADAVNRWVANTTHGRILSLVDPGDVQNVVSLVLNTLFFKGTWRHQFNPNATWNQDFYLHANHTKSTPFMQTKNKFFFTDSVKYNAKMLRMPYKSGKFAMYLIVPNSLTGLDQVFNDISGLRTELSSLSKHLVDVSIPKFEFEYTSQLDGVLRELGIRQAFEDTASFPGLSRGQRPSNRLKISKVLQRTGIVNNEIGSVAYSATEITLVNKFGEDEPKAVVVANKPFMFFIQDESTRQLLFTGRVSDPALFDGAFKLP